MRALITGGYGFVGRHLAHHLVKCGDDVAVAYRPSSKDKLDKGLPLPKTVQTMALDVKNKQSVVELISVVKPDAIYHLAGVSYVPDAESEYMTVYETNTFGTINILEAINNHSKETRFLYVSSSEVYGEPVPGSLPLTEQAVMRPISVYGLTKSSADLAAYKYAYRHGLHTVRVRPFSHTGPGQSERFAISSFAKQVAEIKLGKREPVIKVGNLEVKRDYSDVSDIVIAYREALLNGKRGEAYNLCSGKSVAIADILKLLLEVAEVEAEIKEDPERVRNVDITDVYGSYQRANRDFGWKPRVELEATLHGLFAYWVEELSK